MKQPHIAGVSRETLYNSKWIVELKTVLKVIYVHLSLCYMFQTMLYNSQKVCHMNFLKASIGLPACKEQSNA